MKWRPRIPFKWCRNHHLYYGISIFLFGLYNYFLMKGSGELGKCSFLWYLFMLIGFLVALDDVIEHTVTRDTPLRLVFERYILEHVR